MAKFYYGDNISTLTRKHTEKAFFLLSEIMEVDLNEALVRGMKEELNITITEEQGIFYNKLYFPENSDYPGIESFHTGYSYIVVLNDEQYIEDGYEENQSDKDIYFKWKDIK
jgi:hypothetical protein